MANPTQKLILAFVALILGAVLIAQAAITSDPLTSTSATSETISIATARVTGSPLDINQSKIFTVANPRLTGWKTEVTDCAINFRSVTNGSTTFTATTDYVGNANGTIYFLNTTAVRTSITNNTIAVYDYCSDDYITQGFGRNGIKIGIGMFGIALLITSVGLFYSIGKDAGIVN